MSESVNPYLVQERVPRGERSGSQKLGDGLSDIRKGAAPPEGHRTDPGAGDQQRNDFAGVIGGRCRRIVAVIGGKDNDIVLPHRLEQSVERRVELLQPAVEARDVVPMTPRLVE